MAGVTVPVHVELIGVETGHWCRPCALPSGLRVWYVNRRVAGMCLHSQTGCNEKDHDDVELVDHPQTVWPT